MESDANTDDENKAKDLPPFKAQAQKPQSEWDEYVNDLRKERQHELLQRQNPGRTHNATLM